MGWPIAKRLMAAGHRLTVYDAVRDAPGATDLRATEAEWAESPKQAARGAEIVFTSLPGPDEAREVALGDDSILDGASRDSVYIDLTTNSPRLIRRIHGIYRKRGIGVLDAPVSQGQSWGIIDPIAGHGHHPPGILQRLDHGTLALG